MFATMHGVVPGLTSRHHPDSRFTSFNLTIVDALLDLENDQQIQLYTVHFLQGQLILV